MLLELGIEMIVESAVGVSEGRRANGIDSIYRVSCYRVNTTLRSVKQQLSKFVVKPRPSPSRKVKHAKHKSSWIIRRISIICQSIFKSKQWIVNF